MGWDLDDLARELYKLADASPDRVYRKQGNDERWCLYWHPGAGPGCIFGYALHNLGVNVSNMQPLSIIRYLTEWFRIDPEDPRMQAFMQVQQAQDRGEPWGAAVSRLGLLFPRPERRQEAP